MQNSLEAPVRLSSVCLVFFCICKCMSLIFSFYPRSVSSHNAGPRFTSTDWKGIMPPVDAAMVGRVYLSPKPTSPPPVRSSKRRRRPSRRRSQRRRQNRHALFDDFWSYGDWFDYTDFSDIMGESTTLESKNTPVQNVYFFKRGKNTWSHFYL